MSRRGHPNPSARRHAGNDVGRVNLGRSVFRGGDDGHIPLRAVVGTSHNAGGGPTLVLECGHAVDRDGTRRPKRRRCFECAILGRHPSPDALIDTPVDTAGVECATPECPAETDTYGACAGRDGWSPMKHRNRVDRAVSRKLARLGLAP